MRIVPEARWTVAIGDRFERLEVIGVPFYVKYRPPNVSQFAVCRCDCGSVHAYRIPTLGKSTKSCGCYMREVSAARAKNLNRTHGLTHEPLYKTWQNMISRCERPSSKKNRHYGGRGIRVCDAWKSYFRFEAWALTNGFVPGLTIDRIDSDRNYEPSNCRWLTASENSRLANAVRWGRRR